MLLYHYTDCNAMLSILNNKELWANDIVFMNDYNEFFEGINVLNDLNINNKLDDDSKLFSNYISQSLNIPEMREFWGHYHIISFSTEPDILELWRGYSGSIQKYCLVFEKTELEKSLNDFEYKIIDCIYSLDKKSELIMEFLEKHVKGKMKVQKNGTEQSIAFPKELFVDFFNLSLSFKNSGFKNENEVRVVIYPKNNEMEHRASLQGVIPYTKVSIEKSKISQLWTGPSENKMMTYYSIQSVGNKYKELFLHDKNFLKASNISYR